MNNKLCGIITARGGSKGIQFKNLYPVAGAPLIYYSIINAQRSNIFDRLIVSTDDDKIASVARSYGVEVPFMRPADLALDHTQHFEVMRHAIETLPEKYEYTAIISPTAPTVQGFHWQEALELIEEKQADCVVSVLEMDFKHHPHKALTELFDGYILVPEARRRGIRRQELPTAYFTTGGVYLFRTENILKGDIYGKKVVPYVIDDPQYAIDINEEADLDAARSAILFYETPENRLRDAELYEELKQGRWPHV